MQAGTRIPAQIPGDSEKTRVETTAPTGTAYLVLLSQFDGEYGHKYSGGLGRTRRIAFQYGV